MMSNMLLGQPFCQICGKEYGGERPCPHCAVKPWEIRYYPFPSLT